MNNNLFYAAINAKLVEIVEASRTIPLWSEGCGRNPNAGHVTALEAAYVCMGGKEEVFYWDKRSE